MDLNDTARIRQPRDPVEYRLGTIIDVTYSNPYTTHIRHLRLRFPTGEERTYTPAEIVVCTRTDDHAALVAAFTNACRSLRDACRTAHDYDERINSDILGLLLAIHGTVATHLGVSLDPDNLRCAGRYRAGDTVTVRWTHGRSARRPGAVCGTDDGPGTRVTDEPHLVTCPDCPDAAATEALPDDTTTGDPHVIVMLREAKAGHSSKIGGIFVDATTANAILTVYDAATPRTQAKIASLPIGIMASFAWRVLHQDS